MQKVRWFGTSSLAEFLRSKGYQYKNSLRMASANQQFIPTAFASSAGSAFAVENIVEDFRR